MTRTKNKRQKKIDSDDDWIIEGWVNPTKSGKVYTVSMGEGDDAQLIGFIRASTLEKLVDGDAKAAPIKISPDFEK